MFVNEALPLPTYAVTYISYFIFHERGGLKKQKTRLWVCVPRNCIFMQRKERIHAPKSFGRNSIRSGREGVRPITRVREEEMRDSRLIVANVIVNVEE